MFTCANAVFTDDTIVLSCRRLLRSVDRGTRRSAVGSGVFVTLTSSHTLKPLRDWIPATGFRKKIHVQSCCCLWMPADPKSSKEKCVPSHRPHNSGLLFRSLVVLGQVDCQEKKLSSERRDAIYEKLEMRNDPQFALSPVEQVWWCDSSSCIILLKFSLVYLLNCSLCLCFEGSAAELAPRAVCLVTCALSMEP